MPKKIRPMVDVKFSSLAPKRIRTSNNLEIFSDCEQICEYCQICECQSCQECHEAASGIIYELVEPDAVDIKQSRLILEMSEAAIEQFFEKERYAEIPTKNREVKRYIVV